MNFRRVIACCAVVGSLAGCGGDGGEETTATSSPAATAPTFGAAGSISIKNIAFTPAEVSVKVGDEVIWTWNEPVTHKVKGDGFESPEQSSGVFTHKFEKAGSFAYTCAIHSSMTGTVKVT